MKKVCCVFLSVILLLGTASCGQSGPTWQEQYDLGVRYLSEGNYEEAIIAFAAAIEIDPKQAPAYSGRGQAYVLSGETEENLAAALADFEAALVLDETFAEAWLGIADVYIRQGDYDKALEVLKEALSKTGNDQSIADKIAEMEGGSITDSSNRVRRSVDYTPEGAVEGYTEYEYDSRGRRVRWGNYDYYDNETGELGTAPKLDNYCEVSFNEQDLPERQQFFDADGTPTSFDTFVYNEKGLKVEQHRYRADGEKECYFLFYYNEKNQRIKYESYDTDGSLNAYWISEYDDAGNRTKEVHYDADGTMLGYSTYE